jgi:hypothetical protein
LDGADAASALLSPRDRPAAASSTCSMLPRTPAAASAASCARMCPSPISTSVLSRPFHVNTSMPFSL